MITLRSKIQGMFVGVAIGDALGMPVETWDPTRIYKQYPKGITKYEKPDGHKWFSGQKAGSITDDTQLTIAVAKALIEAKGFNLDIQGKHHVAAMKDTTAGWGHTTVEAIRRLGNGVSWRDSGKTSDPSRGTGNGVPMRVAPLAAWLAICPRDYPFNQQMVNFSAMTHYSKMSAFAGIVHTRILLSTLATQPFAWCNQIDLLDALPMCFEWQIWDDPHFEYNVDHLNPTVDDFEQQMLKLLSCYLEKWTDEKIASEFGGGSCYVNHSLPFTYAYFLRNPKSLQSMFDVINAGGDTDSNGSMVGALLGALNGLEIFEQRADLLLELPCFDQMLDLANQFCDTFGVE